MIEAYSFRKITADEFLAIDFQSDRKFELEDGVVYGLSGATVAHARVQGNLVAWLHTALRGSGFQVYGPSFAIRCNEHTIRYPDLLIEDSAGGLRDDDMTARHPVAVVEVISSPMSQRLDQMRKVAEYQRLPTVSTVAAIHAHNETIRVFQRLGAEQWKACPDVERGDFAIPSVGLTMPRAEVFYRE